MRVHWRSRLPDSSKTATLHLIRSRFYNCTYSGSQKYSNTFRNLLCIYYTKYFKILLVLLRNTTIMTILVKFETNVKTYVEIIRYLRHTPRRSSKYWSNINYHLIMIFNETIFSTNCSCMFAINVISIYIF